MKLAMLVLFALLVPEHSIAQNLNGAWLQDCLSGNRRVETFRERIVIYEERYFADAECRTPWLLFRIPSTFFARGSEIDSRADAHEILLMDARAVDDFNRRRVCGFADWTLGRARRVSGLACDVFRWGTPMRVPPAGTWNYGIWKLEGGLLFFGRLEPGRDGSTPARRPNAWNARFFRKID